MWGEKAALVANWRVTVTEATPCYPSRLGRRAISVHMASTKLSAEDKQAIVELYQEVGQTAATVAKQYGVSVSTISRLLKSELPAETYEALVRQKRGGGETKSKKRTSRKKTVSKLKKETAVPEEEVVQATAEVAEEPVEVEAADVVEEPAPRSRRRRTRSSVDKKRPVSRRKSKEAEVADEAAPEVVESLEAEAVVEVEADELQVDRSKPIKRGRPKLKRSVEDEPAVAEAVEQTDDSLEETVDETKPRRRTRRRTRVRAVEEEPQVVEVTPEADVLEAENSPAELDDSLVLEALDDDELESDDEGFDDAFDDVEEEEEGEHDNITPLRRRAAAEELVQIQPLSEANLSRMLYLVIDRTADLITMPMVFFRDLGQLPAEEEEKKTLPVFENHRVARRFSQRNQRVIKVPDGQLISKTASWLEAKGITRCLLDGQVYSLESSDNN